MHQQIVHTESGTFEMSAPNVTTDGNGFFVSYNACDTSIYGCDTTALVLGQMQNFYILDGDHRQQYAPLIPLGFDTCLVYFAAHSELANKRSCRLPA